MDESELSLVEQAFLHTITMELERGELKFPTAMEVTLRVMEVLDDPDSFNPEKTMSPKEQRRVDEFILYAMAAAFFAGLAHRR